MPEKVSESQVVFERAIHHHVSSALYSQLEKIDEFQLGAVLVHHEKPHSWQFWKKNELDFAGLPFQKLIQAEDAGGLPELHTQTDVVFTATDDRSTRKVDINLGLDGEVKVAYLKFGGDLGGDANKTISIHVSLGAFKHVTSNMFDILASKQLRVDPNHPVVKDAMAKGKSFFVINSVYQSDKVEIKITETVKVGIKDKDTEDTDHDTSGATPTTDKATTDDATTTTDEATTNDATTNDTAPTKPEGAADGAAKEIEKAVNKEVSAEGDESAGASADSTSLLVTNRDVPTNIAFHVIKVDIGKNGVLMPQGRSGFTHSVKIHFPYGDTFVQVTPDEPSATGGATGGATPTEKKSPEHAETKDKPEAPKDDTKKEDPSATAEGTQPKEDPKKDETPKPDDDTTKDTAASEQ